MADQTGDFLVQLADYLETQGIGYATAQADHQVDIFVGKQPTDPDDCVTLLGEPGLNNMNNTIPELQFPRFQVLIRNTSYVAGSLTMRAVRAALHDKIALELQTFFCLYIIADQEGFPIGEDDKGRPEFSMHFNCEIRDGDSILLT